MEKNPGYRNGVCTYLRTLGEIISEKTFFLSWTYTFLQDIFSISNILSMLLLNRVVKIRIILQKVFHPIVFLIGLLNKGRKTKQKLKYKHLNSDPLSVMISVEVNFCKFSPIPAVVQSTDPLSTIELGPILLSYISFRYWNPFVSSVKHAYANYAMYHFT